MARIIGLGELEFSPYHNLPHDEAALCTLILKLKKEDHEYSALGIQTDPRATIQSWECARLNEEEYDPAQPHTFLWDGYYTDGASCASFNLDGIFLFEAYDKVPLPSSLQKDVKACSSYWSSIKDLESEQASVVHCSSLNPSSTTTEKIRDFHWLNNLPLPLVNGLLQLPYRTLVYRIPDDWSRAGAHDLLLEFQADGVVRNTDKLLQSFARKLNEAIRKTH